MPRTAKPTGILDVTIADLARYTSKFTVQTDNDCWVWHGYINNVHNYGYHWNGGRNSLAHRTMLELVSGSVLPANEVCDHLCRNRLCVNPKHIELVDNTTNVFRGTGITATNRKKTHCKRGHELSGYNLITYPNGQRQCRTCKRTMDYKSKARRKAFEDRYKEEL